MKVYKTKQEASDFFGLLSDSDYIFFANECSKFFYHSCNAENGEKKTFDILEANEKLKKENESLKETIERSKENRKTENERFRFKLHQEQITERKRISEAKERLYETKYKNDIDNMKNKNRLLEAQLLNIHQRKCEYDKILTEPLRKFKEDMKYLVKKPEKSPEIRTDDELTVENILKQHPFLKPERKTKSSTEEILVGFESSDIKAMVVVKPYQKHPISEVEVKKFIDDLDKSSGVKCGIFIAKKNRFETMYQEYKVYKTSKKKPYFMISNLLDRTYHEIPLLFALSALQLIVDPTSIEGHEAIQLADKCIKDWVEMQKSADKMLRVAKNFKDEANKMIEKIKNSIVDTNERLAKLRKKATGLVEESSTTSIESTEVQSPTKKLRTDE